MSDLDPRIPEEEVQAHPVEDLVPYHLDPEHLERTVMLGSKLVPGTQAEIEQTLREHKNVFAWSHEDMPGIDPAVMCHQLNIDMKHWPVIQKRRAFNPESYEAINVEVQKLLVVGFIREVTYPD